MKCFTVIMGIHYLSLSIIGSSTTSELPIVAVSPTASNAFSGSGVQRCGEMDERMSRVSLYSESGLLVGPVHPRTVTVFASNRTAPGRDPQFDSLPFFSPLPSHRTF
jgi:hypothetical protein